MIAAIAINNVSGKECGINKVTYFVLLVRWAAKPQADRQEGDANKQRQPPTPASSEQYWSNYSIF